MYRFRDEINYTNFFRFDRNLVLRKIWAGLPKASKSIYPVILVHCNAKGECFPGQETIAILSGITPKTVREGIKGLNGFPGFEYKKKTTSRGHKSFEYKIALTPDKKGSSFPLYKCVFEGGNWSQLTSSAHSVYIVMRTFSFFDGELYCDHEDLEYGYDVDGLIKSGKYQQREYDFVNADLEIIAEYSGISRSATYKALDNLKKVDFIEETYSFDEYDTWKIFRIPKIYYKRNWLNSIIKKRYQKQNKRKDLFIPPNLLPSRQGKEINYSVP